MLEAADRSARSRPIPALAAEMKLAILPGFDVLVPAGKAGRRDVQEDSALQPPGRDWLRRSAGPASARRTRRPRARCSAIADQPGMTVGCVNPALPGSTDWVKLDSYWFTRSTLPVPGGPIRWSNARPAIDALRPHPGTGIGKMHQRRPARLSFDPDQPRARRQVDRPYRRRGRSARHVPAGLGHAPCRHGRSPGRPRPRSRRDQFSIQNSRSTLSSSACGKLDRQCRGRGEHAIFDRVHGLAGDADPLRELGLGEGELGPPFLQPVGEPFSHPEARAARACRN